MLLIDGDAVGRPRSRGPPGSGYCGTLRDHYCRHGAISRQPHPAGSQAPYEIPFGRALQSMSNSSGQYHCGIM